MSRIIVHVLQIKKQTGLLKPAITLPRFKLGGSGVDDHPTVVCLIAKAILFPSFLVSPHKH